jgi:DNA-binding transcriptional LysR family regulator
VPSVEALRAGTLDVALTFDTPDAPELDRSGLEVVAVGSDAMQALLPVTDPRADEDEIALGDLRDEPWILPRGDTCARLVERSCRREGFEPRVTLTTDDHAAARSLVAEGMGVALVPQLLHQRDDAAVVVRPVRPAPIREVLVAVRDDGTSSPAALGLRDAFVASSSA